MRAVLLTQKGTKHMSEKVQDDAFYGQVIFLGETLGPFYLNDPQKDDIDAAYQAIADLQAEEAAQEWPFVAPDEALSNLSLMQSGLQPELISEELTWEYRRLFIGPAKKPAPPWGSVYTDREMVVFGESTLELRQWLRENGIERLGGNKTPEDHIGLMLLLMAWIAENRPECLKDYLTHHFFTWSSHFLEELIEVSEQPFFEGLARLTKASLEGIQDYLGLQIEYPKFYR